MSAMKMLIAIGITLISIAAASAGDKRAIVQHPDYGTRIVNDNWERQNQRPSGGPIRRSACKVVHTKTSAISRARVLISQRVAPSRSVAAPRSKGRADRI
jgi:hypothetical protein